MGPLTRFPDGISFFKKGRQQHPSGLSHTIWNDCPMVQLSLDPSFGFIYFDDFLAFDSGGSFYGFAGTGGSSAPATGAFGGEVTLSTGTTANNDRYMTTNKNAAGLVWIGSNAIWCVEARLRLNTNNAIQGAFFGLTKETGLANDWLADSTMVPTTQNLIGFNVLCTSGSAVWRTIYCKDGGTLTVLNDNVAPVVSNGWVKLGMKCVGKVVTFYVNGVADSQTVSTSATNFPVGTVLQVTFGIKTGDTTNRTLRIDWWCAAQRRL